ncbi:MAG: hypothetical protein A2X36_04030 [Elusimicrobia bacterium GWA2_69_24]|nr:MAG: hypothetical protein A2X36_04030 [Elusimicrobia bacterium GWA2_69_24]
MSGKRMDGPYSAGWDIIHSCDYRCPYCFFIPSWTTDAEATNARHLVVSKEEWLRFWDLCYKAAGSFQIEIAGGEPFRHPDLVPIVQGIARRHSVRIVTNLSVAPALILDHLDPKTVCFSVSFHPQFASAEVLAEKLRRLAVAGFPTAASIVAYPPYFPELAGWLGILESAGVRCYLNPFQGVWEGARYPQSYTMGEVELLRRHAFAAEPAVRLAERSPRGRLCAAGRRYFRIWPDGTIYRCCAATELGLKPLGHVRDGKVPLSAADAPCPAERCFAPNEVVHLSPG